MRYTMKHTIEADSERFWKSFFDLEFNRALYYECLDFEGYELLSEHVDHDGVLHRQVECTPKAVLPAAIRKVFGNGGWKEIGRFVPGAARYVAQWIPNLGSDKFRTSFEMWTEPLGSGRCERFMMVDNTIRVFGFGAQLERISEKGQRDVWARVSDFHNRWIAERDLHRP